jgi:hypothetical protein
MVLAAVLIVLGVAVDRADASTVGRCRQYESALAAHGLPVATFSRIMWRESNCKPWVTNRRSGAAGLLQILPAHAGAWRTCPGRNLYSVNGNLACAARLYHKAGLRPWRT